MDHSNSCCVAAFDGRQGFNGALARDECSGRMAGIASVLGSRFRRIAAADLGRHRLSPSELTIPQPGTQARNSECNTKRVGTSEVSQAKIAGVFEGAAMGDVALHITPAPDEKHAYAYREAV